MKRILIVLMIFALALTASAELPIAGGWYTPGEILPEEAVSALNAAAKDRRDCAYEPVACLGAQVVAGMNYRLLCRLTPVDPEAQRGYALVYVYAHLDGSAEITDIICLDPALLSPVTYLLEVDPNPVMNFVGSYMDRVSQRASMTIEWEDFGVASVTISWANSAFETVIWRFTGVFDPETSAIPYADCVQTIETCAEDGTITQTVIYENGTGALTVTDENEILWRDDVENAGETCVFEFNF